MVEGKPLIVVVVVVSSTHMYLYLLCSTVQTIQVYFALEGAKAAIIVLYILLNIAMFTWKFIGMLLQLLLLLLLLLLWQLRPFLMVIV